VTAALVENLLVVTFSGLVAYYGVNAVLGDPSVWWISACCATLFLRDLYYA